MEKVNNQRIAWIDILKGIGIIFVVLGHVIHNDMIFNWIYSFHMPLFFFAGGYLYKKDTNILRNIKHKFRSIMVPYFSFGLLTLLYWYLIERKFRDSSQTLGEAFLGLLSGEYQYLDFNVHLWFLPCFFLVVVIYNILNCLFEEKWVMLISVVMALIHSFITLPELIWGAEKVFQYIIFFSVGRCLNELMIDNKVGHRILVLVVVACLVGNITLSVYGFNKGILWYVVALMGILPWVVLSQGTKHMKVLEGFGRISVVVLCVHGPIYRVLIKIASMICRCSTDVIRNNIISSIAIVVVTLMTCFIVYKVLIRLTPNLLGNKANL